MEDAINRLHHLMPAAALAVTACGGGAITLPADPIDRAATCSIAAAAHIRDTTKAMGALSFEQQAQISHYALLAGAEGKEFDQDRAAATAARAQTLQEDVTGSDWKSLVEPCRTAYPQAVAEGAVALPADRNDAQLGCYTLAAFLGKMLQGSDPAVEERLIALGALNRKLDPQIGVAFARRGLAPDSDRVKALRNEALANAAKLGPPAAVMQACETRFG